MPEVYPIIVPQIDWRVLIDMITYASGQSPTKILDNNNETPDNYPALLKILPNHNNRHLTFSFLVVEIRESWLEKIAHLTRLHVVIGHNYGVLTGHLEAWKQSVIRVSELEIEPEILRVFNRCQLYLEQVKLDGLWKDYRKKTVDEGIFILESRYDYFGSTAGRKT
jgi:hypothetical protein